MKRYSVVVELHKNGQKAETVFVEVEAGTVKLAIRRALNQLSKNSLTSEYYKNVKGVSEIADD